MGEQPFFARPAPAAYAGRSAVRYNGSVCYPSDFKPKDVRV
jgi:hypothetical protein